MGKDKQAQRTKNNARPSNSSRSAEFLGTTAQNLVGFSALKDTGFTPSSNITNGGGYQSLLPTLSKITISEVDMKNIDPKFQLVLKKMNKKDSTTKCKALQEFMELCNDSEQSSIESILSFWSRLYGQLANDIEHKVRETTQLAHGAIVKRVGKNIAFHLKQLAGPWFISQYDTYPPAASAALNSFNETFPPNKVVSAIIHCQEEILNYIFENISSQASYSQPKKSSHTSEELEAKHQRLLVSSLQSYCFYLKMVPSAEIEKTIEIHRKILEKNSKFWKLSNHEHIPIKTSFFNVLASVIENAVELLENEKKRAMTSIINSLDEIDPGLLSAIWEAMLIAVTKLENWFQAISIEKFLLPKLWRVLKNGSQCCPTIMYPNLLPLLGQFPKFNLDSMELFSNFFNNMREGFTTKNVKLTHSETSTILISFVECLRYAIVVNISNQDICLTLLKEQLMPIIEFSLKENISYGKILFPEISQLIRYWTKQSNECINYSNLVDNFWKELDIIFEKLSISGDENFEEKENTSIFTSQIDFLLVLRNSPVPKPIRKVKFSADSNIEIVTKIKNPISEDDCQFTDRFEKFIHAFSITWFNKMNSESSKMNIQRFLKLVSNFESKELFIALSKSFDADADLMSFFKVLKSWLNGKTEEDTKAAVQLVFILLKYLEESNQMIVLNSLLDLKNNIVLKNAVFNALSKQNRNNKVIKSWCSNFDIGLIFNEVVRSIFIDDSIDVDESQKMILLAFEATDDGVPLIPTEAIKTIVSTLNNCADYHESKSEFLVNFISQILEIMCAYKYISDSFLVESICLMLSKLFQVIINFKMKENSIKSSWKRNIFRVRQIIPHSHFLNLVKNLSSILWFECSYTLPLVDMDLQLDTAVDFLESIIESSGYCETDQNGEIIKHFLIISELGKSILDNSSLAVHSEIVIGNLYKPCLGNGLYKKKYIQNKEKIRIWKDIITIDLDEKFTGNDQLFFTWALFTTKLLNNLLSRMNEKNPDQGSRSLESITFSAFLELFFNIIYSFTLGSIYCKHYKFTESCTNVNSFLHEISKEFTILKEFLTMDIRKEIRNYFYDNVHDKILPHLLHVYHSEFEPDVTPSMYFKDYENILSTEEHKRISYIRGVQILPQYFDDEKVLGCLDNENCSLEEALILARSKLTNQTQDLKLIEVLDKVLKSPKGNPCCSLYAKVISEFDPTVSLTLETVKSLTKLVSILPTKLTTDHWDFIMTSMIEFQVSILQTLTWYKTEGIDFYPIHVTSFIIAVTKLYCAVQKLMNEHEKEPISELPPELLDEWKNVFLINTQVGIAQIWINCSNTLTEFSQNFTCDVNAAFLLNILGTSIKLLDGRIICKKQDDESRINSVTPDEVISNSINIFKTKDLNVQLGGYYMLNHISLELIERDKDLILDDNFDPKSLKIVEFEKLILSCVYIVHDCHTISSRIEFQDNCILKYLFIWSVVLNMCARAQKDLRYQYAEILKEKCFPYLMETIYKLMPMELLQDTKAKSPKLFELFTTKPSLEFFKSLTEWRLDHIACWLYSNCLRYLPVLVRQWWSTTDSRVSVAIDKITSIYVSPMLCQEELQSNKFVNIENMQVKVFPSAREIIALYQMDETKLELSIVLSNNHPLGAVTITPCQYVGGTANWRNCHMQLSILLSHQNGSLWDGLMLWKTNLDKKFAGIEECCICFSVFHISTYQIPKSSCHTCRKKFHTSCLYKWFNTSQKSSCPICRNVF